MAGRRKADANVCNQIVSITKMSYDIDITFVNCSFVIISGATPFSTALSMELVSIQNRMSSHRSIICIHGRGCLPLPMRPPSPKENGSISDCIMPDSRPSTTPDRILTYN